MRILSLAFLCSLVACSLQSHNENSHVDSLSQQLKCTLKTLDTLCRDIKPTALELSCPIVGICSEQYMLTIKFQKNSEKNELLKIIFHKKGKKSEKEVTFRYFFDNKTPASEALTAIEGQKALIAANALTALSAQS